MLDIDRALWMLAYNNVLVNLDSYSGAFAQNYYLYRDDNERFCSIIWDVNMAFGGFSNTGASNLNVAGMQQMPPTLHYNYAARPLIVTLLTDSRFSKMYIAHIRTITNEFFGSGNYLTRAQQFQTLIDSSVQAEQFYLYTYPQFQNAITTAVSNTPGISQLMSARTTYLIATTEFQQVAPTISTVLASPASPALNDTIWVTATVTNSNQVFLGWRSQTYNRFYRYAMYDDGLHNDGAANDNVFGAWLPAIAASMQYYVYAENANAGMFSPERAEYEFYTITVAVQTAAAGEIVINELLASNFADTTDETAQHEDWIELYNRTAYPLSLQGLYLTDDYTVPQKFPLPDLVIPAFSYILVWADQDQASSSNIHANFKLSSLGEQVMLSNFAGIVIDSVSFGAQTTDISYGRCPSATGPFTVFLNSTPLALNTCPASVEEQPEQVNLRVFPNPAQEQVNLVFSEPFTGTVALMDAQGRLVKKENTSSATLNWNIAELPAGIYLIVVRNVDEQLLYNQRLVIAR
ncbi:MAG: CotH kinase family protein, partial [Bacteroidia bacterium]